MSSFEIQSTDELKSNIFKWISEGNTCLLSDGTNGICKNIYECQAIIEDIRKNGTPQPETIPLCSFMVNSNKIICSIDVIKMK